MEDRGIETRSALELENFPSEDFLREAVFPQMVARVLHFESFEKPLALGLSYYLCIPRAYPKVRLLCFEIDRRLHPLAVFYKYLDDTNFYGAYFPIFESTCKPNPKYFRVLESAFLEFEKNIAEDFSRMIPPKSFSVHFHRVNTYGVDQGIRYEAARILFSDLPVFPTVYPVTNPYLPALLEEGISRVSDEDRILVVGTGAGVEATFLAATLRQRIDAVDIDRMAVANTIASSMKTKTRRFIRAWQSDAWQKVPGYYDRIFFNAPFPVRESVRSDSNIEDGEGRMLKAFLSELPFHLNKGGELLLMTSPDLSPYLPAEIEAKVLRLFSVMGRSFSIQSLQAVH